MSKKCQKLRISACQENVKAVITAIRVYAKKRMIKTAKCQENVKKMSKVETDTTQSLRKGEIQEELAIKYEARKKELLIKKEKPATDIIDEPYAEFRALDRKLCAALPVGHSYQLNFDTGEYEIKPCRRP